MDKHDESNWREIKIEGLEPVTASPFVLNKVTSSRYTWISFIPKNLFEQFQRTANIWFLIVSVFQLVPLDLNPESSWSTILPLCILLSISLIKDAFSTYTCLQQDKITNSALYKFWNGQVFTEIKSSNIIVGQFLQINQGEKVPADVLLILNDSSENNIFVDSSQTTGESNLTIKKISSEIQMFCNSNEIEYVMKKLVGQVKFEQPSSDFNSLNGKMHLEKFPKTIEITSENMLYRGSIFHGTSWVVGLVLYTGIETKIYLNTKPPKKKVSRMEKTVNAWVLYILIILLIVVIFSSLASELISSYNNKSFIENFIIYTVLYNNIIPISLFVTVDIVKALQLIFVNHKFKPEIKFNSSDINENMGQVEFILADKTGTITQNKLKLNSIMIDFCVYERESALEHIMTQMEEGLLMENKGKQDTEHTSILGLQAAFRNSEESNLTSHFIKCMLVCNGVFPTNGKFLGTSPDEVALIESAKELGFKLISRTASSCKVEWGNTSIGFEILAQQNFSKESKVSRILVKDSNSKGFYYIKAGIDPIEDNLLLSSEDKNLLNETLNHLRQKGLRTMILAYRELSSDELSSFELKLESARSFPVNAEIRIAELFPCIEYDMRLLGATGIEEVIPRDTEDCIELLKDSGIKLWLLSGDGESNTMLTAHKAGIFSSEVNVFRINKIKTVPQCNKMLKRALDHLIFHEDDESISHVIRFLTRKSTIVRIEENFHDYRNLSAENQSVLGASEDILPDHPIYAKLGSKDNDTYQILNRRFVPENLNYAISIDAHSLRIALSNEETQKLLVCLLVCAESVSFHSLLPHDKANIIKLVKENLSFNPLTLAIGDGDADIPMMQIADVAINVASSSSQAKNYCEVTISRFSVLQTLLLDIGHWNYYRLSVTILLFLYKNFMITIIIFLYFIVSDYSANSIFPDSLTVGYNLFNTTLPLICIGVFDYFLYQTGTKTEKYAEGLHGLMFNYRKLIEYSLLAIFQGFMLFAFCISFGSLKIVSSGGYTEDIQLIGTSLYICLVWTVLIEISLKAIRHNLLYWASHFLSIMLLTIHIAALSSIQYFDLYQVGQQILRSEIFLCLIFTLPSLTAISNWLVLRILTRFFPKPETRDRLDQYRSNLNKIYKSKNRLRKESENNIFDFHKYSLRFCSEYIQKVYEQIFIQQNIKFFKLTIIILWVVLIGWTVLVSVLFKYDLIFIIIRALICAGFTVVAAISTTNYFMNHYVSYITLIITLSLFAKFATEIALKNIGSLSTGIVPSITYILFNVNWLSITALNVLNQLLFIISMVYSFAMISSIGKTEIFLIFSFIIINIAIALTSAVVGHNLEKNNRLEYKLIKTKELGVEKTQRILSFLLPSFVKKRVKDGARYIAEDQGTVTILFCDISNFESIVAEYTPQELTGFLDSLFQKFDNLCSSNGVTKIETVGKTYMACAGLKDSEDELESEIIALNHGQRVLNLALAMIQEVLKMKLKNRKQLCVKIGINSGPVTAGVVGYHKPQFSLVGDTVNTASRMCSTLEINNKIQLSKASYDLLTDHKGMYFTTNNIEAKGKGKMITYIVNEGVKSASEEAWLEISHLSSIAPLVSTIHTIDKNESIRKPRRSVLTSFHYNDVTDFENTEGVEKLKIFDFKCRETEMVKEFRKNTLINNRDMMAVGLLIACICYTLLFILGLVYYVIGELDNSTLIIHVISICLLWLTLSLYKKIYLLGLYQILFVLSALSMLAQALIYIFYTDILSDFAALQVMFITLIIAHTSGLTLGKMIWISMIIFLLWITTSVIISTDTAYITNAVLIVGFILINLSAVYKREIQLRSYFNLKNLAEKEIEKTENLLTQMMPPHVLENMKKGKSVTDRFAQVTLLFADIVGFTFWSSDKSPEQVVGMLSELFTKFDKICVDHKVYKVHTIGDCYVVMGLMDVHKRDTGQECLNVINMGLSMIKVIEEVNLARFSKLNMRIGVHTGEVIGGVIGTNIVRYDIYGPDVLIANKMESGGEAGKINVSDVTKEILEKRFSGHFKFTFNKIIEAKGVSRGYKSYFLSPKQY